MESGEPAIAMHPFTKEMNPAFLDLLKVCATFECFSSDQQLFHEGHDAERFYLIQTGRVALQTFVPGSGPVTIQTVGGGEALGWSWLYPPFRWHFSARALEPVEAAGLCARTLRNLMQTNQEFGREIALRVGNVLLERLQSTRLRLLQMYDAPK